MILLIFIIKKGYYYIMSPKRKKFEYPTLDSIKFTNEIVNLMSTRKADRYKLLLDDRFIRHVIDEAKKAKGNVYDKAAILLRGLIVSHGFASGNKRTAFLVTTYFITKNRGRVKLKNFDMVERVLRNIRLYTIRDIANWLRKGEIDAKFQ